MPPRGSSQLAQEALRCLQRVSQEAPAAVPGEAVAQLDAAARALLAHTLQHCVQGNADHTIMVPSGMHTLVWDAAGVEDPTPRGIS